jgi:hypothetical protein
MSALVMFLNNDRFLCLDRLFRAEETSSSLLNDFMVMVLKHKSEFFQWLYVVNIHYIYPLQLFAG